MLSNTSVVYRVEHQSDGLGPYRHTWSNFSRYDKFHTLCNTTESHPSLFEDEFISGKNICVNDYLDLSNESLFCFLSKNSLKSWFGKVFDILHKEGFHIVIYLIDSDQLSVYKTQAVIRSCSKLELLNVYSIYDYFIEKDKKC